MKAASDKSGQEVTQQIWKPDLPWWEDTLWQKASKKKSSREYPRDSLIQVEHSHLSDKGNSNNDAPALLTTKRKPKSAS